MKCANCSSAKTHYVTLGRWECDKCGYHHPTHTVKNTRAPDERDELLQDLRDTSASMAKMVDAQDARIAELEVQVRDAECSAGFYKSDMEDRDNRIVALESVIKAHEESDHIALDGAGIEMKLRIAELEAEVAKREIIHHNYWQAINDQDMQIHELLSALKETTGYLAHFAAVCEDPAKSCVKATLDKIDKLIEFHDRVSFHNDRALAMSPEAAETVTDKGKE